VKSEADRPRVAAVVVTHNRLALLQECVAAVRGQTRRPDEIIVVDNASTDGTPGWLAAQPDLTVITQANLGSGGGQHTGIKAAHGRGHDWFWCMDDDGRPGLAALEALLRHAGGGYDWLNSVVLDTKDPTRLTHGVIHRGRGLRTAAEVRAVSHPIESANPFNGTLLGRSLVDRIGLPNPDLFIWGEEVEYHRRAAAAGARIAMIADSEFFHPALPWPDAIVTTPVRRFGKFYYYVRNSLARTTHRGTRVRLHPRAAAGQGRRLSWVLLRTLPRSPLRNLAKMGIILHAVFAAFTNDTRRRYL
jgi:rhamnopyranosyl-N-acetylglucosaminyl-diphospho-decaprenol beta-1,3/1,4-galactofuranosyltransferase